MESNRWGIIYSGGKRLNHYKHWIEIQEYIEKKYIQYDLIQSSGTGSVERLTRMLCDNGYHTIVLVGNDTSLNESLNAIMTSGDLPEDFCFGLFPIGYSNDFARFWDVSEEDYKHTVDAIIAHRTKRIDVGYVVYTDEDNVPHQRYFLNCVNIGLGARLVDATETFTRLTGSKQLSMIPTSIMNIFEQRSFRVTMRADAEDIEQDVLSICIGNCHGYGQTPNAVPYNNHLDMSIITRPKASQWFKGFYLLGKGRFLNYENVHPYRLEKIAFDDISKAKVSLDGCLLNEKQLTPMRIGIEGAALNFVI